MYFMNYKDTIDNTAMNALGGTEGEKSKRETESNGSGGRARESMCHEDTCSP